MPSNRASSRNGINGRSRNAATIKSGMSLSMANPNRCECHAIVTSRRDGRATARLRAEPRRRALRLERHPHCSQVTSARPVQRRDGESGWSIADIGIGRFGHIGHARDARTHAAQEALAAGICGRSAHNERPRLKVFTPGARPIHPARFEARRTNAEDCNPKHDHARPQGEGEGSSQRHPSTLRLQKRPAAGRGRTERAFQILEIVKARLL